MKSTRKMFIYGLVIFLIVVTIVCIISKSLSLNIQNTINTNIEFKHKKEESEIAYLSDKSIIANIPIFMYHWIKDDTGDYMYPENMVKPAELRKQMEYLNENNYDVIFVSELDKVQHYEKPVILTFDDGWEDVYFHAFPLAKELNMKICMYIITDLVGTPGYCTLDELKEMRDSGIVEIDSHTLSHPYLDELTKEKVSEELINSKKYIKDNLDIESKVICYPSGRSNNTVIEIAKENYKYGLLMDGGVFKYNSNTSNIYEIKRIYAMRSMTLNTFKSYCEQSMVKIN